MNSLKLATMMPQVAPVCSPGPAKLALMMAQSTRARTAAAIQSTVSRVTSALAGVL